MPVRAAVVAVTVVAALATGCTASDWESARDADRTTTTVRYAKDTRGVRRSLIDHLSKPAQSYNQWSPSAEEARCVADRMLERFGLERLLDAGFEPQSGSLAVAWTPEERRAAVNILVGCIDFSAGVLELLAGYDKVPLSVASCFSRGGERRGLPDLLAGGLVDERSEDPFAGDGELARVLGELSAECLGAQDLVPGGPVPLMPADERNDPGDSLSRTTTTTTDR